MVYFNIYDKDNKAIKSYSTDICYDTSNNNYIKLTAYGQAKEICKYKKTRYILKKEDFNAEQEPEKIKPINNAAIDDNTSKGLIKKEPKTKKSQLDAVAKYQKSRAEIRLRVSPEIKRMADANAKYKGLSLTAYISQLIEQDTSERAAEDLEQWKDDMQLMDENGLDEPIALNGLDVDIRDFDNMDDAIAEADKRHKEFYGI